MNPKTVRKALKESGTQDGHERSDKINVDMEHLSNLYARCDGYGQRIYEILTEEEKLNIGYSTLTRIIRENGIGQKTDMRCHHVPDMPGDEMQHDTTTYKVKLGSETRKVVCSGLYLRYSKMRYIKFYFHFNRFRMKCFLHEALRHWGYSARRCVIDNTNLAILSGTGKQAVIHPEMEAFSKPYGFDWLAHEKGHSNRKAGKERNFWTVETNFLPGRTFGNMEDLNRQAFEWGTQRYALRPQSVTRLIPVELFEKEKPYLMKLPGFVEPPYQPHKRTIDDYGYVAFDVNYYWVPGKSTGEVDVIEYPDKLKIFPKDTDSVEYTLTGTELRNQKYVPDGVDTNPYQPRYIKKPCHEEEKLLRDTGETCCLYLDFIQSSAVRQKPRFIRELYGFSKKLSPSLFLSVIERAIKYRVTDINVLTRIAQQLMGKEFLQLPEITVNGDYETREAYRQGRFSLEQDLKHYQDLLNGNTENEEEQT